MAVSCFPPSKGGVEKSSYRLAMGLAQKGHDVTVVTSSRGMKPGTYEEMMGPLRVRRYPETRYLLEAPFLPRIALAALTEDYDVLHVHGMTPSVTELAIIMAKLRGKRVVLTYHNDAETHLNGLIGAVAGSVYAKLMLPIMRMVDKIVSTTYSYAATSPVLRHMLEGVTVIPWGTDAVAPEVRAAAEVQQESRRVLFVGQLKQYKGVHVLLDSLARLNGSGHAISIDIVGNGPHSESLKSMARELEIAERVRFWGAVPDEKLAELYNKCDLLALPSLSRREAFGMVLLDAFAAGKPVVASNIPGVRDIAMLGGGHLVEPNDSESLSEAILRVARKERSDGVSLKRVAEEHSWSRVLVKYEEVLRDATRGLVPWTYSSSTTSASVAPQVTGSAGWLNSSPASATDASS